MSLSESLDTSTPAGKMVFTVLGAVAELERSLIAERVRAGMRNARIKGKRIGRPPRTQFSPKTAKRLQRLTGVRTLVTGSWQRDSILPSELFSGVHELTKRIASLLV